MGWEWHCLTNAPTGVDSIGVMAAMVAALGGSVGDRSRPDYAFGRVDINGREHNVLVTSGPDDHMILVEDETPEAAWDAAKRVVAALRREGWESDDDPGKDQSFCLSVGAYN